MQEVEVRITADTEDLERELRSLADVPELSLEVRDYLLRALSGGSQAISIDCEDGSAGRAGDLRVRIKLSDFMLGFVAALRAGHGDQTIV
jgi:hypothetical protein